jgi:hypothetical protein
MTSSRIVLEEVAPVPEDTHLTQLPTAQNADGTPYVYGSFSDDDLKVDLSIFETPERNLVLSDGDEPSALTAEDRGALDAAVEGNADDDRRQVVHGEDTEQTPQGEGEAVEFEVTVNDGEEDQHSYEVTAPALPGITWHEPHIQRAIQELAPLELNGDQLNGLLSWYGQDLARQAGEIEARLAERDRASREVGRAALKAEFGDAFENVRQAIDGVLQDEDIFENGSGELLAGARFNGDRVINDPGVAKGLARLVLLASQNAREIEAVAAQAASDDAVEEVEEADDDSDNEIDAIESLMRENIDAYRQIRQFGPDKSQTGQERLYQLMRRKTDA